MIEPYKDLDRKDDDIVLLSPRKETPSRDTIYQSLMKRLHEKDTLLDYGRSFSPPQTAPAFFTTTKTTLPKKPRTVPAWKTAGPRVQKEVVHFPDDISEENETGKEMEYNVEDLIARLQEAKTVARGNNSQHILTAK